MRMQKVFLTLIFCLTSLNATNINIEVAANVSYAMDELSAAFEKQYPNISVKSTIGSSGKLSAQIMHGAPYGLFLSANMLYPQKLYEHGFATSKPRVYAQGALAYLSTKNIDFTKPTTMLTQKSIHKIAIANPKTAPYGKAAQEFLQNSHLYSKLRPKLIYGESIAQTLFFTLNAADIGIVAKSALLSKNMKTIGKKTKSLDVDPSLYTPIQQGLVLLSLSKQEPAYQLFYAFLFTPAAQKIFLQFGYLLP